MLSGHANNWHALRPYGCFGYSRVLLSRGTDEDEVMGPLSRVAAVLCGRWTTRTNAKRVVSRSGRERAIYDDALPYWPKSVPFSPAPSWVLITGIKVLGATRDRQPTNRSDDPSRPAYRKTDMARHSHSKHPFSCRGQQEIQCIQPRLPAIRQYQRLQEK